MHLVQIEYKQFIDANKVERIEADPTGSIRLVINGKMHFVRDEFKDQAIKDILTNCTPTSGRDALQGMVSG